MLARGKADSPSHRRFWTFPVGAGSTLWRMGREPVTVPTPCAEVWGRESLGALGRRPGASQAGGKTEQAVRQKNKPDSSG